MSDDKQIYKFSFTVKAKDEAEAIEKAQDLHLNPSDMDIEELIVPCPGCKRVDGWEREPPYCSHCGWGSQN